MNILFYCPFNFNIKSSKLKSLGGIESLNIELSKFLSKSNYKIFLATYCKKIIKRKNLVNLPVDFLLKNKSRFEFKNIISSNDPTIFNHFKNYQYLNFLSIFPEKSKIYFSPKFDFLDMLRFFGKSKNARAEISRKTHRRMPRDLSYETDSGPKTKLEIDPFFGPLKN